MDEGVRGYVNRDPNQGFASFFTRKAKSRKKQAHPGWVSAN